MSRLNELLNEYCPDGVEYRLISEVCETITDYTAAGSFADIAKNVQYINNDKGYAQLIRTTDLKSRFENNDRFVYVDEHAFKYLWRVNLDKEGLVLPNVGNCGEVYYVTPDIFPEDNNVLGPNAIWVRSETVLNRYLYHVFLAGEFQTKLAKIVSPTGQTKFNKTNFKELTIPVPPIEVQREIVRILDNFTELTEELTEELTARKKQYEYYRDQLLNIKKDVDFLPLSIVANVFRGEYITKKGSKPGNIPVILGGQEPAYYIDKANHYGEIVVVARSGASAGFVSYWNEPIFVTDGFGYEAKEKVAIPKYLYYVLKRKEKELNEMKRGAGVPHVSGEMLGQIELPVPSLEVQKRLVNVLDNFDAICSDLNIGLPAEIEARNKQYAYYRDLLLSFSSSQLVNVERERERERESRSTAQ